MLEIVQAPRGGASKFEYFQCSHSAGATSKGCQGFLAHFFVVFQLRRRWERFFRHLCGELPRRAGWRLVMLSVQAEPRCPRHEAQSE